MAATKASIIVKSPREVELLRSAGRVVCQVLDALAELVRPGVTTAALDARAAELIRAADAMPLFKGVPNPRASLPPFPACICASVNEQIVHGIPADVPLNEGDIVSVDCGVRLKGYCGDSARTFAVGRISAEAERLLAVTREALEIAIREIRPGRRWSGVARLMEKHVESGGFGVVREFVGHGIGQEMHEEPKIPNYYDPGSDFELRPGMTLAVEPMVTAGSHLAKPGDETGWPVVTKDGSWAAHFEHSLAVTEDGCDVLTDGR